MIKKINLHEIHKVYKNLIISEQHHIQKGDNNFLLKMGNTLSQIFINYICKEKIATILKFLHQNTLALHISALPIDTHIPNTPYDGYVDLNNIRICVSNIIGINRLIGLHPVVYHGENDGELIRNVIPHQNLKNDISSYGSTKTFKPHVDNPDLPLFNNNIHSSVISPDTLSLFCIRNNSDVPTDLIFINDIISQLDFNTIKVLMMPIFKIKRPDSFTTVNKNNMIEKQPILEKDNYGNFVSRFDAHRVFSDNKIGNMAIKAFTEACSCKNIINNIYMNPGDLLLFKNKRVLHSRRGFSPSFDGYDRWLIRLFGLYKKPDASMLLSDADLTHLNTDYNAFSKTFKCA